MTHRTNSGIHLSTYIFLMDIRCDFAGQATDYQRIHLLLTACKSGVLLDRHAHVNPCHRFPLLSDVLQSEETRI